MSAPNINSNRKDFIPLFLIISILLHLLILLIFKNQLISIDDFVKEKETYIEITDIPIPKEKETEPPEKTTRFADRSHKTDKETTRDKFTKLKKSKKIVAPPTKKPASTPNQVAKSKDIKKEKKSEPKKTKKQKEYDIKDDILRKDKREELSKKKTEESKKNNQLAKKNIETPPQKQDQFDFPYDHNTDKNYIGSDINKKEVVVDLNTTQYKYTSYFSKLREKIYQVWKYPNESKLKGEQGNLRIIFTINKNGQLEDVRLLKSSGFEKLDREVIRTINVASPFYPFPSSWEEEKLKIPAVFNYQLGYHRRYIR